MSRQIILASASQQRLKAMKTLGLDFMVFPSDVDEQAIQANTPEERAEKVARAKAEKIQLSYPEAIIISGDTYGFYQGQAFEKPKDLAEAKEMLSLLSGKTLQALTGFCYLDKLNKLDFSTVKVMEVKLRDLTPSEIEKYVQTEPVLTWSAAFCPAYDSGAVLIEEFKGSYTGFTYGLPMEEVAKYLNKSKVL